MVVVVVQVVQMVELVVQVQPTRDLLVVVLPQVMNQVAVVAQVWSVLMVVQEFQGQAETALQHLLRVHRSLTVEVEAVVKERLLQGDY